MARFAYSLRWKVLMVLALVALITALLLGGLGLTAVRGLSSLARDRASVALEQEVRQGLVSRAQEKARADDALFEGVRSQAVTLARYVAWYYDQPENLPDTGYLKGGSTLEQTPQGHWVNLPTTPVGVFVSRQSPITAAVWTEVGTLSFADPLLRSIRESTPGAERAWVISDTRIVRIFPNLKLGQLGSPVGPDYDLTEDEPFQAASPDRNPDHLAVWTAPYQDPVTGNYMMTAAAPIYGADGKFKAVAGVDMTLTSVLEDVLQAQPEAGAYAFLLDREGRVISAPDEAMADLGLPPGQVQQPGRAATTPLADSAVAGVKELADRIHGASAPGLTGFAVAGGRRYAAFAPLPTTGWVLSLVAPAKQAEASSAAVQAGINRLEALYVGGGIAGLLLAMLLALFLAVRASRALTDPVEKLLEGTRRLVKDLSYRLPDLGPDELGQLATAFNDMAASLKESKAEAVHHARAVVEERNRLAREIHDTIAQGLTGMVVYLETGEACLESGDAAEALKNLQTARELARSSLRDARQSVWNLRPSAVAEADLKQAMTSLRAGLCRDGIDCEMEIQEGLALPERVEDTLYRVCQEAFANVRQHSKARRVQVTLGVVDGEAIMRIADDGHGFDPERQTGPRPGGGFGLWAMRGRLRNVGGLLEVESKPGSGTTVEARVSFGGLRDDAGN